MMNKSSHWLSAVLAGMLSALSAPSVWSQSVPEEMTATVIDRNGNRHEVRKLRIRGDDDLEYYVDGRRRLVPLSQLSRLQIQGSGSVEEVPVRVELRSGAVEKGTILIMGANTPHQDVSIGGGGLTDRLTGSTAIGPLYLLMSDVREVFLRHPSGSEAQSFRLKATVINLNGERYEVDGLRYEGGTKFRYAQGRKKRKIDMTKVERFEFAEPIGGESRPVIITFKTGRMVSGTVDASTVRLPGETDRLFGTRVDSSFTGTTTVGRFGMGLHAVKLVIFRDDEQQAEVNSTAADSADHTQIAAPVEESN